MPDQPLTSLPEATTPDGTEHAYIVQGGVSKRVLYSTIFAASIASGGALAALDSVTGAQIDDGSVAVADLANGTDGELVTWDTSGVADTIGVGTAGQILTSQGAGAVPTWETASGGFTTEDAQDGTGAMLSGGALAYTDATPLLTIASTDFGDVTTSSSGTVWNIDGDVVGNTELRNSGALSVIGRSANSTGDPADISASAASGAVLRESGSTLGFGTVATAGYADDSVTFAKMQEVTGNGVVAKSGTGTGNLTYMQPGAASQVLRHDGGSSIGWGTITTVSISDVAGSTYTPTLTSVSNISSSTASECQYLRIAASVTVSCKIAITCSSTETPATLGVSLPVASNLGADSDLSGVGATTGVTAILYGDATNNRAELAFYPGASCAERTFWSTLTYQVI